jgi:hypothetical protein
MVIVSNLSDEIPPKTNWEFWPRSVRWDHLKNLHKLNFIKCAQ